MVLRPELDVGRVQGHQADDRARHALGELAALKHTRQLGPRRLAGALVLVAVPAALVLTVVPAALVLLLLVLLLLVLFLLVLGVPATLVLAAVVVPVLVPLGRRGCDRRHDDGRRRRNRWRRRGRGRRRRGCWRRRRRRYWRRWRGRSAVGRRDARLGCPRPEPRRPGNRNRDRSDIGADRESGQPAALHGCLSDSAHAVRSRRLVFGKPGAGRCCLALGRTQRAFGA